MTPYYRKLGHLLQYIVRNAPRIKWLEALATCPAMHHQDIQSGCIIYPSVPWWYKTIPELRANLSILLAWELCVYWELFGQAFSSSMSWRTLFVGHSVAWCSCLQEICKLMLNGAIWAEWCPEVGFRQMHHLAWMPSESNTFTSSCMFQRHRKWDIKSLCQFVQFCGLSVMAVTPGN